MSTTQTSTSPIGGSLLSALLSEDSYRPAQPRSLEELGLSASFLEGMTCKLISAVGALTGRTAAERLCVPYGILENIMQDLRQRQILTHAGSNAFNDYYYTLTDQGRERAQSANRECTYVGPAPVPLEDYVLSVEAQTVRAETVQKKDLQKAFDGLSVEHDLFQNLGPAVNSGAGMFLYGSPGNGKTTLAKRITACFGQDIWVPHCIMEDGQIIKFYDEAFHEKVDTQSHSILKDDDFDMRWVRIKRPTVVVGGELTMDALEIRTDMHANVSEAPIQLKSNCGCLLIDDFGRQRIEPAELLNRWIVPLENKHDFLTLPTGKKIQTPFEQLVIFSTNLEPKDLVDEAFLRRIPYKIEVRDPQPEEFHKLFKYCCKSLNIPYDETCVNYVIQELYVKGNRPMRRCHPRDLLSQIRNSCVYEGWPVKMTPEHFEQVARSYFTVMGEPSEGTCAKGV